MPPGSPSVGQGTAQESLGQPGSARLSAQAKFQKDLIVVLLSDSGIWITSAQHRELLHPALFPAHASTMFSLIWTHRIYEPGEIKLEGTIQFFCFPSLLMNGKDYPRAGISNYTLAPALTPVQIMTQLQVLHLLNTRVILLRHLASFSITLQLCHFGGLPPWASNTAHTSTFPL